MNHHPGRLAAAPKGLTKPDRATRIGFGASLANPRPWPLRGLSPAGDEGIRFMRRGWREAQWSH